MAIAAADPAPADVMTWRRGPRRCRQPRRRRCCSADGIDQRKASRIEVAAEAPELAIGMRRPTIRKRSREWTGRDGNDPTHADHPGVVRGVVSDHDEAFPGAGRASFVLKELAGEEGFEPSIF